MTDKQEIGPNQRKWLDALRSGEYKQGRMALRTMDDKFCCLGVSCEIAGLKKRAHNGRYLYMDDEATVPEEFLGTIDVSCSSTLAPKKVVEFFGFYSNGGRNLTNDASLIGLNDSETPFSKIADIVEANPAEYFKEPR